MKFATTATAATAVLATGASAQLGNITTGGGVAPLDLLKSISAILSTDCRETVTGLLAPNSSFGQCIQTKNMLPILMNNQTTIIPEVDEYLQGICSSPACDDDVVEEASDAITDKCAQDLQNFGLSTSLVETVFGAYDTIREVACLSTS